MHNVIIQNLVCKCVCTSLVITELLITATITKKGIAFKEEKRVIRCF